MSNFNNPVSKLFMKTIVTVFFIMFILIIGKFAFSFENAFEFPDKIQNIINETYIIKTTTHYSYMEVEKTEEIEAIAIYIGKGYFVALTHATEHKGYIKFSYGYASMTQVVDIEKYDFVINDKSVHLIGRFDDISLFKSKLTKESFIKFGDSDLLRIGDKTITIGNSLMYGINVKDGMVSNLGFDYNLQGFNKNISILISDPINNGDSGGIVLAKDNNEYYLIGIAHGYVIYGENMGCAFRSNYIKNVLKYITKDVNFLE